MSQRPNQIRRQRAVAETRRRFTSSERREPGPTMQLLAREELREIVRRLALGDRPGIALEQISSRR